MVSASTFAFLFLIDETSDLSEKFGLPRAYDKSYRIPLSVVTPDLSYKLRREQERREDGGREGEGVSLFTCSDLTSSISSIVSVNGPPRGASDSFETLYKL